MEYEDDELLGSLVMATDSPPFAPTSYPSMNLQMSNNDSAVSPVLINATTFVTNATTIAPSSVLPSLASIKIWAENRKICELITQAIQDLTRDLDPFAAMLIVVAVIIAIVGVIAIVCQCQMWRKSKRQRHYDSTSWLEYSLDREKLTHNNNNNHNAKLQRQLENKKFISKLFQSSLLPPVPLPSLTGHHQKQQMPAGHKPFCLNDSQLYLNAPNKHFTVDIDQCQLVQSFMKHSETGKQYMDAKKGKSKDKTAQKKGAKKGKLVPTKGVVDSGKNRNRSKNLKQSKISSPDTLPFFASSSMSSKSSTENRSSQGTLPSAALQKEYETQTLELNLTGSDDGESQTNVSIDEKIYERIVHHTSTNPRSSGVVATVASANRPVNGSAKPTQTKVVSHFTSKPSAAPQPPQTKQQSSTNIISNSHSNARLRQLVPPGNIGEAMARANVHSRSVANKLANAASNNNSRNHSKSPYYQTANHKPNSDGAAAAGTLAKNPLYSEIGEHEESIIFSDDNHPAATNGAKCSLGGGFALENDSRLYAQIQPPMMARQLTYSTFIKPPSPPYR